MPSKSRKPSKKQMSDDINAKFASFGVEVDIDWSRLKPEDLAQVYEIAMGIEDMVKLFKDQMPGDKSKPSAVPRTLLGTPFMRNRPFLRMMAESRGDDMPIVSAARETVADGIRDLRESGAIRKAMSDAFLSEGKLAKKVAEKDAK